MFSTKGESEYKKGLECITLPNNNVIDAMGYFKQAAEMGHIEAIFQVGYLKLFGEPYIMKNEKEAFECFEKCMKAGLAKAKYFNAIFYLEGKIVEKDEKKAVNLLEQAFKEGVYEASNFLYKCYWKGIGTEIDCKKAKYYNEYARNLGDKNQRLCAEIDFFHLAGRGQDWLEDIKKHL